MLRECVEVFEHELNKKGERLILDSYIPADGTYLIVDREGNIRDPIEIIGDKTTKEVDKSSRYFPDICFYDYNSQLISMNKPMDAKKIIHSNNYLSFFVKKDSIATGKLTDDIIDGYYETLKDPIQQKYKKSKEATTIYEHFAAEQGTVDKEAAVRCKEWIKEHIRSLDMVDMTRKDYLKIFFEADYGDYEREGRRYFLPNLYNSNDYNIEIENSVLGLPDNNMGMNAKKPLLSFKSRKTPAPYLLNGEEAMMQKKFFDYLLNLASARRYNIYVETEQKQIKACPDGDAPEKVECGYYLRIRKGKNEAEILNQDNVSGYYQKLDPLFAFENIVAAKHERHPEYLKYYCGYEKRTEVGQVINEVFFSGWLGRNYYTEAGDITTTDGILKQSILLSRDAVFDWMSIGIDRGFARILEQVSLNLIKGTLMKGYNNRERALCQMNLWWSIEKRFIGERGGNMAEIISGLRESIGEKVLAKTTIPLENDREYYYAVGQLAAYLISLNKAKDKNQSLVNPFFNAKADEEIKRRILQLYKRYNYAISENYKRVKNLLALIEGYVPEEEVDQHMILLGYASDNLIYTKEDK